MLEKTFTSAVLSLLMVKLVLLALWITGPVPQIEPFLNYTLNGRLIIAGTGIFITLMSIALYRELAIVQAAA